MGNSRMYPRKGGHLTLLIPLQSNVRHLRKRQAKEKLLYYKEKWLGEVYAGPI